MKVLFFSPYIYDPNHSEFAVSASGFGYMVKDILSGVAKHEDVYLITHKFSKGYKDGYTALRHTKISVLSGLSFHDIVRGIKILFTAKDSLSYKLRYAYYYFNTGAVRKAINEISPDVVHIHGLTLQTKPVIELCEELGCDYIVTLHGLIGVNDIVNTSVENKRYEYEGLKQLEIKKRSVTVVSSGVKKHIVEDYGLSGENIDVILNGIEIPEITKTEMTKDKKYIICVGSISKHKNQIQLVRCIDLMNDEEKKAIEVHIVGAPSEEIDIQGEIESRNLQENIYFHGFVPRKKISEMWKNADLNVVMSRSEGFGLSIVEGYSFGVPCLAYRDIDAVEDLYNENAMMLMTSESDAHVIQSIRVSLKRSWNHSEIIAFSKEFSLAKVCQKYVDKYHDLVGRKCDE